MMEFFGKVIENLTQVVDLLKSNLLSICISLAIFCGFILILPESLFSHFYLSDLRRNYITIIGAIAFTSLFITIILILYRILKLLYLYIRGSYFELYRLTFEECNRVNHFISNKSLTATFNTTDGVVYMLQDKGLIYKAQSVMVAEHYEQDSHIYRWIYSKLTKYPELITEKIKNSK